MSTGDLEARVAKLERQNRRLRRGALLGLVAIGAAAILAPGRRQGVVERGRMLGNVEARQFILRDARGRRRALLHANDLAVTFALYGGNGRANVGITVTEDGSPTLDMYDRAGKLRATLLVADPGPTIRFFGPAGGRPIWLAPR